MSDLISVSRIYTLFCFEDNHPCIQYLHPQFIAVSYKQTIQQMYHIVADLVHIVESFYSRPPNSRVAVGCGMREPQARGTAQRRTCDIYHLESHIHEPALYPFSASVSELS
jgi:hypothetical protein